VPRPASLLLVAVLGGVLAPPEADARRFNCRRAERRLASLEGKAMRRCGEASGCRARQVRRIARATDRLADECVALNQIQVLGTHNSYHVTPREPLLSALLAFLPAFSAIEYTHVPLGEQLERQGIRQVELDVFADPEGGLFASRGGLAAVGLDPRSGLPELDAPGLKVLHIQDIDFETTCLTLVACLTAIKTWSDAHPGHLPIMVLVEAKDDVIPDIGGVHFAVPVPFGAAELDAVDAEVLSVFPPEQLIRPDDVRGDHATLEEAVLTDGWPVLAAARGRVLFALDNGGAKRDAYRAGRPSLEGRVLFTDGSPGDPDAAFVKENDPLADPARIPDLVRTGYIVRTRADADTEQARTGDTTRRDAALGGGAQFVSSDYPEPNPAFGTGYFVAIPDGSPGRCNPVNAPPGCRSRGLEHLD
jgi:hypothetical protein